MTHRNLPLISAQAAFYALELELLKKNLLISRTIFQFATAVAMIYLVVIFVHFVVKNKILGKDIGYERHK